MNGARGSSRITDHGSLLTHHASLLFAHLPPDQLYPAGERVVAARRLVLQSGLLVVFGGADLQA